MGNMKVIRSKTRPTTRLTIKKINEKESKTDEDTNHLKGSVSKDLVGRFPFTLNKGNTCIIYMCYHYV